MVYRAGQTRGMDETPRSTDRRDFGGVIGRDWRTSTPWWPPESAPPAGAPNVLMLVLDDVGFAQLGCYGSDISTPTFDGLAADGIRMSNFHTTALCSPTALVPPHRAEPPPQRNGPRRRPRGRLPGLLGPHPTRERLPVGDPPRPRLRDVRGGQVASHARRRDAHGRVASVVADRSRLRPLVRVPRRRDAPVRAVAVPRQPFGAAAGAAGGRLPPERRSRRPRHRVPR